jgi:KaiC/GvpD/RAD55 family RecA-like ATPase
LIFLEAKRRVVSLRELVVEQHNLIAMYSRELSIFVLKSEHAPTGIPGLDEILGGGYPRGRVILITGGPGSGKTVMAMQFLLDGVDRFDERGVFVSLEESKHHLVTEMSNFGWDVEKYEKKNQIAIVDASPLRQISKDPDQESEKPVVPTTAPQEHEKDVRIRAPDFSIQALTTVIRSYVRVTRATRIVVDPITSLSLQFLDNHQRRIAIVDLLESLIGMGTTSIVTTEIAGQFSFANGHREIPPEEYLCHGVVILHNSHFAGRGMVSALEIEKMRECKHDRQLHPYSITENGIAVYSERFLG